MFGPLGFGIAADDSSSSLIGVESEDGITADGSMETCTIREFWISLDWVGVGVSPTKRAYVLSEGCELKSVV